MRKGLLGLLPLLFACAAGTGPEDGSNEPTPTVTVAWSHPGDGDGRGACDRDQTAVINGREVSLPALCNPLADQIWDPPPDLAQQPLEVERVLPPDHVKP